MTCGLIVTFLQPKSSNARLRRAHESISEACRETGAACSNIRQVMEGKRNKASGLIFELIEYEEEEGVTWNEVIANGGCIRVSDHPRPLFESQTGIRYEPIASEAPGHDYAQCQINGLDYLFHELSHAAFPKTGAAAAAEYFGDDAQIDHLDGNKKNNHHSNLKSVKPSVNTKRSMNKELHPDRKSSAEKQGLKVRAWKASGDDSERRSRPRAAIEYTVYPSLNQASLATGCGRKAITKRINGELSTPLNGYMFDEVPFVPRKDDDGNNEVFRKVVCTTEGLYCAANRRRCSWEEFYPASSSYTPSGSRKRRQATRDADDDGNLGVGDEFEEAQAVRDAATAAAMRAAREERAEARRRGQRETPEEDDDALLHGGSFANGFARGADTTTPTSGTTARTERAERRQM